MAKTQRQKFRWQKFRRWISTSRWTSIWGKLAIAQVILLLFLYWSWPPVSLTLVVPGSEISYWSAIIQDFEAEHPNIRLRPIGLNNPQGDITVNLKQICTLAVSERSLCDIIYLDVIWVPELASRGWIQPLDQRISSDELSEFVDSEVEAGRHDGNLYRIPFRADFGMLYYRDDFLAQADHSIPITFQDLLSTSQELQRKGLAKWGFIWPSQREDLISIFVEVLHGYGGFWIDADTQRIGLDQPEAIAAVNLLVQTIDLGVSPPISTPYSNEEAATAFLQGDTVFMRNWPYVLGDSLSSTSNSTALDSLDSLDSENRAEALERLPRINRVPMALYADHLHADHLHAEQKEGGACKGSWGFGIARRSQHPRQAWQAIQYLTSQNAQQRLVEETSYIPSRTSLLSHPKIRSAAKNAILRPPLANYADASLILQRHLVEILEGQISPEDGMRAAATETQALLNQSF